MTSNPGRSAGTSWRPPVTLGTPSFSRAWVEAQTDGRSDVALEFGDGPGDKFFAVDFNSKLFAADAADDAEGRARAGDDPLKARALRLVEADDDARGRLGEEVRRGGQVPAVEFDFRADRLTPQ